jgi:hypothetical protein
MYRASQRRGLIEGSVRPVYRRSLRTTQDDHQVLRPEPQELSPAPAVPARRTTGSGPAGSASHARPATSNANERKAACTGRRPLTVLWPK